MSHASRAGVSNGLQGAGVDGRVNQTTPTGKFRVGRERGIRKNRLSDGEETVDGGTLTLGTVAGGDVGHGELAKVVTDHLGLDLGVDKEATGVDANHGANHLGDDNHVTEVSLDGGGLLVRLALGLGLTETLDEAHGLALETTLESSAGTGVDERHEILVGHVEESIELDTSVGELAESSLALELGSGGGVVLIPTKVGK